MDSPLYETVYENGNVIDSYQAAYDVAFSETASDKDQIKAWSFLIGTGEAERVKGWYKLHADNLVKSGMISDKGVVNWTEYEAYLAGKSKVKYMKVDSKSTKPKVEKAAPKRFEPTITVKKK